MNFIYFFPSLCSIVCFIHVILIYPYIFLVFQALLQQKERQIEELESTVDQLKARFTELLAVMPATNAYTGIDSDIVSSLMLNSKFMPDPNDSHESSMKSPLDPNAPIYTPKSPDL